jgi:hypothetical protein
MTPPRDNFETFFSPGGDSDPSDKKDQPVTPPSKMNTKPFLGETQANVDSTDKDTPAGMDRTIDPRPVASPALQAVREELIGLEIINESQWNEALARAGTRHELMVVLEELKKLPSTRRMRNEPPPPLLTKFQANEILAGQARKLRLGQYLIVDRLGAGGMGEVFKAWNLSLDRIEAIKMLNSGDVSGSSTSIARFDREARVLAQLHHPCITTIFNTGRIDGTAYIAMEYVRGRTLLQVVREAQGKSEKVPVEWAVDAMKEVAGALDHAHAMGVIHRDIKPNNIMVTDEGEIRVLDMGIARLLDPDRKTPTSSLTQQVAGLGTPEVMPPEQWADATSVSPASDIYSLGCTFYYVLAGQMPFKAENLHGLMTSHLMEPPPNVTQVRRGVSPALAETIKKMMAKEPQERFGTCKDLIAALDAPEAGRSTKGKKSGEIATGGAEKGIPAWVWLSAAAAIAGIVVAVGSAFIERTDYRQRRDEFLVTFQQANGDTWPTLEGLRSAVQAGPYAEIRDAETFTEFEGWLRQRTRELETQREDFLTWVNALQAKNTAIWTDTNQPFVFVKSEMASATSPAQFDVLRSILTNETTRRQELQEQANNQLSQLHGEHQEVAGTPEELAAVANNVRPLANVTQPEHVEERTKAVEQEIQNRWSKKLDAEFSAIHSQHPKVWNDPAVVRQFAERKHKLASVKSSKDIEQVRSHLAIESWRRRANDWVVTFQEANPAAWKSAETLTQYVAENFPEDVQSEEEFQRMQNLVQTETRRRAPADLASLAKAYQTSHPLVWKSADDILAAVKSRLPAKMSSSDAPELFANAARTVSYERIFPETAKRVMAAGDAKSLSTYRQMRYLAILDQLLRLGSQGSQKPSIGVVLTIETPDGRTVDTSDIEATLALNVTASKSGYPVLIVLGDSGNVFAFEWASPLQPGVKTQLITFDGGEAGVDQYFVFVSDVNWADRLPPYPNSLADKVTQRPGRTLKDGRPSLEGLLLVPDPDNPASQLPLLLFRGPEIQKLSDSLPTKLLLNDLHDHLKTGSAPDYMPPGDGKLRWGRGSTELKWVKKSE